MCGIAGAFTEEGGRLPSPETADRMCRTLAHRGPDDQGIHRADRAFIGMRRLSIIDLQTGHQPIHNEDETVWAVFNGEIYNFQELRQELEARGHRFYTRSDSECIVHAYEEYGTECFARLRGMFAIAIWDDARQQLVLARDRFGKKPLYYADAGGRLVFASELKALLAAGDVDRSLSPPAVRDFLALGYVPAPASIFASVSKLPPAHYMVVGRGQRTLRRYWDLAFEPKWAAPAAELEERLLAELEDAVRVRLVSDVPFGAFLSGGTDSSVVVALMARNMGRPVSTFSIGFREAEFSELDDARLVAAHVGADHHELVVEPDAAALLQDLVHYFDEPFGDSSLIPTYLVARLAAGHVKMVLSGDGGDELFGGYERYRRYAVVESVAAAPLGPAVVSALGRVLPGRLGTRARWLGSRAAMEYPDSYLSGVGLNGPALVGQLLREPYRGNGIYSSVRRHFLKEGITRSADRVMAGDMQTYLPDDVLVKVDRATMANSLESRAPLLDHRLAEFAARLPVEMKIGGGVGKRILRRVQRRLLPPRWADKPKQGFAIPLAAWLRGPLREATRDLVSSRRFRERGVFAPAAVEACVREHEEGRADRGETLWLVLTFELWARRYLDGP